MLTNTHQTLNTNKQQDDDPVLQTEEPNYAARQHGPDLISNVTMLLQDIIMSPTELVEDILAYCPICL